MKIKKWLWTQKEGLILGLIYGAICPLAGLGMATLSEVHWYFKLLIFPVVIADLIPLQGIGAFILSIIIGGLFGIIIDCLYKPKE